MRLLIKFLLTIAATAVVLAAVFLGGALWWLNRGLPDHRQLANYEPAVVTRVHAGDGSLIAEYARERRLYVPIGVIPELVVGAFLSAEDKNFRSHEGIDPVGVMRAMFQNVVNVFQGRRLQGASTITQQVAKNFLLTSDVTIERKLREILLAFRLEQSFSKDRILELYLNEIYLGSGSYGVAAAALNYFDKPLDRLTIAEAAYLAALPKAPNNYHPFRHRAAAVARRNWVLRRMEEDLRITAVQSRDARAADLVVTPRRRGVQLTEAGYFAEEIRRRLIDRYGEQGLYEGGLSVRTTLDPHLQAIARKSLRDGLVAYDKRHGWRGPVARVAAGTGWLDALIQTDIPGDLAPWRLAAVQSVSPGEARISLRPRRLSSGAFEAKREEGVIPFSDVAWASPALSGGLTGAPPGSMLDVLSAGDIIHVEPVDGHYALRQFPKVNGAIIAIDPFTGRVPVMSGGFSARHSEFNRATQAWRQPGSAFKPFVYAAALDAGFTPSSIILDTPFAIPEGSGVGMWKPHNYGDKFHGPSTLRTGMEKSRNVMTVRLAQQIGMKPIVEYADRFGIAGNLPQVLSIALGAGETTLMRLTTAYAIFVNGGRKISPVFIDRIQDRWGQTAFRQDERGCDSCNAAVWRIHSPPNLPDPRPQIIDPRTAYQVVSMLEGVVERGTGRSVRVDGRPLAGKTGTTNGEHDAWFVGFSPNLAVGVFIGFDDPESLGQGETGGRVAAPVFREFMRDALKDQPIPFRIPPGINLVRVNGQTGLPAVAGDESVVLEAFKPGTEPVAGPLQPASEDGGIDGLY